MAFIYIIIILFIVQLKTKFYLSINNFDKTFFELLKIEEKLSEIFYMWIYKRQHIYPLTYALKEKKKIFKKYL